MRTIRLQNVLALAALVFLLAAPRPGSAEDDARTLVEKVLDSTPDVPYVSSIRLTTPGSLERRFELSAKPLEDDLDGRFIRVTDPFNLKDTRYLFYERTAKPDEQFVYIPAMKRAIRLSEKSRREPFLGSTFYIIDMVEPALDDFTYRFVGDQEVGGRSCRLVESLPKNPEKEFYGKSVSAIDPVDLVVMRSELYDRKGKLLKILTVEKIEKIDGFWTPLLERMDNVQDDTDSVMETVEIRYRVPLGDELFQISNLLN